MSDKYDIYDEHGRKIGTAKRKLSSYEQGQRAGEQLAGAAIFLYLFWKPLLALVVILSIIAAPFLIILGIGEAIDNVRTKMENPKLEQRFREEIKATIEQGVSLLSTSLREGYVNPNLKEFFTDDAFNQIVQRIDYNNQNGYVVEQTIAIKSVNSIRFLEGRGDLLYDAQKMSKVTYACVSMDIEGTQILIAQEGTTIEQSRLLNILLLGLERQNGRWKIIESQLGAVDDGWGKVSTGLLGFGVNSEIDYWAVLVSYCH